MKGNKEVLAPNNRIIVQNLDYDTTPEKLEEYFSHYGKVVETEIPMNPKTNRSKGFGFVTFSSVEEATKAISQEEGHEIDGRNARTSYAKAREKKDTSPDQLEKGKKLYIGKLPWEINQEELKEYFEKFGPVEDAFLPTVKYASPVKGYAVHKGFGFITYVNEEDANKAVLQKNHKFKNEPISVRKAKPQEENRSPKVDKQSPSSGDDRKGGKRRPKQGGEKKYQGKKDIKHEKSKEDSHERKDVEKQGGEPNKEHTSSPHDNSPARTEDKHDEKTSHAPREDSKEKKPSEHTKSKTRNTTTKKKESPSSKPKQAPVVISKPPAENPWKKSASGDSADNTTKDFPSLGKKKTKNPKDDKGKEDKGKDDKETN